MLKLILVRHGETERNLAAKVQGGKSDIPLNENGKRQARLVGFALRRERLVAIYSSPLRRAFDTAREISLYHRLRIEKLPDLSEIDMGIVDGLDLEEIKENHKDFWRQWQKEDYLAQLPGGESPFQVRQRAWNALQSIIQRHREGCVVIVSHGISLQTIITALLEAPLSSFSHIYLGLASITVFHIEDGRTSLILLNDTCHLRTIR